MKKKIVSLITVAGLVSSLTVASAASWQGGRQGANHARFWQTTCSAAFGRDWTQLPAVPEYAGEADDTLDTGVQYPDTAEDSVSGDLLDSSYASEVLRLVNEYRAQYGLEALTLNNKLSEVAQAKAQDMKDNNYFSHNSPTYGTAFEMMKSFGISYSAAGENIAMGYSSPSAVVEGWMNSEGHRANILNGSFTQMGLGYAGNYWCQMFIG